MQTSESDFYKTIISIDSTNVNDKLESLVSECNAQKIVYNDDVHHVDMTFIKDNEILLVKTDILSDEEKVLSWLADEEVFGDGPPLYFSETSHRESPVYDMIEEKKKFSYIYPEPEYKIYVLLLCNYSIINEDEVQETWDSMSVFVVDNVIGLSSLKDNVNKPADEDSDDNGSANEGNDTTDPVSNKDDEEFERLLHDFIASEYNDEDTPAENTSLAKKKVQKLRYAPISPKDVFSINYVEVYGVYDEGKRSSSALKIINTKGLESVFLVIELQYILDEIPKGKFNIRVYNDSGRVMFRKNIVPEYVFTPADNEYTCIVASDILPDEGGKWNRGRYLVEIRYNGITLNAYSFAIDAKSEKGSLFVKKEDTTECSALSELNDMIGLHSVKEQMDKLKSIIMMNKRRKDIGLTTTCPTLHAVFMGNPGTGKTTVAKLYGKMLKELGLLSSGHVVVKTRSSLMGQNYASEQEKTVAAINEAKGGVLFIDEAYLLYKPDDKRDPGISVLETLLSEMKSNNNDWVLLMAGYTEEMLALISANAGFDSRIPVSNRFVFKDYTVDEMMSIADKFCNDNNYFLTSDARLALKNRILSDYKKRDRSFGNGRYVCDILTNDVFQAMAVRLRNIENPSFVQLMKIENEDIPAIEIKENPFKKLNSMIGLKYLKMEFERHLNMVRMMKKRNEMGIISNIPPLHMAFLGNPGTGKTTVADLIGEIYASLGILSIGKVICVERKDLVGQYIGDTEQNVKEMLKKAKGNVLFIDEAYSLYQDDSSKDFGHIVLDSLLTTLSKDNIDMLVILAGYTDEMEKLLDSNVGLRSRIPYKFYFEDYTVDELIEIGKKIAKDNKYRFTASALKALKEYVGEMMKERKESWGNARYISRLITNEIIPNMSTRLLNMDADKQHDSRALTTICKSDIPTYNSATVDTKRITRLDENAISEILSDLDNMTGLENIKKDIHDFVKVAMNLNKSGKSYSKMFSLRWNFIGNTGTGKSTVAGIIGRLLKALRILESGHVVEIKLEEFYNVSEYKADTILKKAVMKSIKGVLFIDADASLFKKPGYSFDSNIIMYKLTSMLAEISGNNAIIIAENENHKGLKLINHTLTFSDYSAEELLIILRQCLFKNNLHLSEEASLRMSDYIKGLCSRRDLGYANARTMKVISDTLAERHLRDNSKNDNTICINDVSSFVWNDSYKEKRIGFVY